jgi:exoribonuclease R
MAGRASVELYTLVFFADRTAETDARIVKVKETSIVVFVPKYGIEGIVWLAQKGDTSSFTLDLAKQTVAAVDGSAAYAMFDTVRGRSLNLSVPPSVPPPTCRRRCFENRVRPPGRASKAGATADGTVL